MGLGYFLSELLVYEASGKLDTNGTWEVLVSSLLWVFVSFVLLVHERSVITYVNFCVFLICHFVQEDYRYLISRVLED